MPAQNISDVIGKEREAVRLSEGQAGSRTDGTLAVSEQPSTPYKPQPADARPERFVSRDPDAFPRPTGREEEWRFTPLDRLGGLLDVPATTPDGHVAGADGKVVVEVDAAPEVQVSAIDPDHPLVGSVLTPADRVAAL